MLGIYLTTWNEYRQNARVDVAYLCDGIKDAGAHFDGDITHAQFPQAQTIHYGKLGDTPTLEVTSTFASMDITSENTAT